MLYAVFCRVAISGSLPGVGVHRRLNKLLEALWVVLDGVVLCDGKQVPERDGNFKKLSGHVSDEPNRKLRSFDARLSSLFCQGLQVSSLLQR